MIARSKEDGGCCDRALSPCLCRRGLRRQRGFATPLLAIAALLGAFLAPTGFAQREVDPPGVAAKRKAERKQEKAQEQIAKRSNVAIIGATAFKDEILRLELKEQIAAIEELGLTAPRADDAAFLLELFYRKHGFRDAEVRYAIAGSQLRLTVSEGVRVVVGNVNFVGNESIPSEKLFEFFIGPTRERYAKTDKTLPFVPGDLEEGIDLVRRLYVAEGFLNVIVQAPKYSFSAGGTVVDMTVAIVERQQYSFGNVRFTGRTVYEPEELQEAIADILREPYTDRHVADIPRRLQAYFKQRGYYDVKVEATGSPDAANGGRVPVQVIISPGPVYYFDGTTVTGLQRLRPSYITKRFRKLSGKKYNPELLDEKFREMMKSGLFSILQIKPVALDGNLLHLQITAEEAKSKEFGFSLGYGSYAGLIVGASYRDRNLFGYGRPVSTSAEYSSRGYKGDITFEDPYLFDSEWRLKARLFALTYDFDAYSKDELGIRLDLDRQITKVYRAGAVFSARYVDVTSDAVDPLLLGRTSYLVNTVGITQNLELRQSPLASPRGLVVDHTFDYAGEPIGSDIEFVRSTARVSYFLPFAKENKVVRITPLVTEQEDITGWENWFRRTMLAFGARAGVIHSLNDEVIPIDERFYNGGANSVRSFAERELGPKSRGEPIGGEFFTIFNAEYTFPVYGELQLAVFADAGNLVAQAEEAGFDDMRYAIGLGLRYQLPIGPLRIDYGVNPDRRDGEAFGAFHFSFGFAF